MNRRNFLLLGAASAATATAAHASLPGGRMLMMHQLGPLPVNLVKPSLSWSVPTTQPVEGAIVTCDGGQWTGLNVSLSYRWFLDGPPSQGGTIIAGANSGSYIPTIDLAYNRRLCCEVTGTTPHGSTVVYSNISPPVINGIIAQLDFRATIGKATDPDRNAYVTAADLTNSVVTLSGRLNVPSGGTYQVGLYNSLTFSDGSGSPPPTLEGGASTSTSGKICVPVPLNVPVRVRVGMGAWSSLADVGIAVYDGDPDATGTNAGVLITGTVTATGEQWGGASTTYPNPMATTTIPAPQKLPSGELMDITGQFLAGTWGGGTSVFEAQNRSITVVATKAVAGQPANWGALYFVRPRPSGPSTATRYIKVAYPTVDPATTGLGPYYVDYVNGDDNNDGLAPYGTSTTSGPWKHGPGDPNAGSRVSSFVPADGATIYWEGGQDHFLAKYQGQISFQTILIGGSSASSRVTHAARPGTGNAVWRGDEPQPTGWSSATSDPLLHVGNGPPAQAGIAEKLTPSYAGTCFQQFLTAGGKRFYPAQYPSPTAPASWENSDSGCDAYFQMQAATYTTNVSVDSSGLVFTMLDPTYLPRYGAEGLKGYVICYRTTGNLTYEATILTGPDAVTGAITWKIPAASSGYLPSGQGYNPTTKQGGLFDWFYCIRYHPRDLEMPGQYAWAYDPTQSFLQTCYGTFGTGFPGARGITRLKRIMDVSVSHLAFNSVDMHFTAGPFNSGVADAGMAILNPANASVDDITFSGCNFAGFQCPSRPAVIGFGNTSFYNATNTAVGLTITNCTIDDAQGRGLSMTTTSASYLKASITNFIATRIGRTCDYVEPRTNPGTDPLNIGVHQFVRGSNCSTFHGNGLSIYGSTNNYNVFNCEFLNHTQPVTAQAPNATGSTRNNHWKGVIASGRRTRPGVRTRPSDGTGPWNSNTVHVGRFDGGEVGSLIEQYVGVYSSGGYGLYLGDTNGLSTGLTIRNAVLDTLGCAHSNTFTGVNFENALILSPAFPIFQQSDIIGHGGTVQGNVVFQAGDYSITGYISGTTLTVTSPPPYPVSSSNGLAKCMPITGAGVAYGTTIVQPIPGQVNPDGTGNYQVNISQSVWGPGSPGTLGTSTKWNGVFTSLMQQYLTQVPNGAGSSGVYQDIVMGLAWSVPKYGSTYVLSDCDIDNKSVAVGWQADDAFATVINTQIDSVLDLPAGVGDNALFYLDHGQVFFRANAVAGTYTLNIRQTNVGNPFLSGSSVHTTAITVTVS